MTPIISEYILLAEKHGESSLQGDARSGNSIHKKLMKIVSAIRTQPESVRKEFYSLLHHSHNSVRIWTAVTLLKTFEAESLKVLKNIGSTDNSILGLSARTSIDCWNKNILTDVENWNV